LRGGPTVLVLRLSAVGDVILTAPAIDALRRAWPDCRVVFAVKEGFRALVASRPDVDHVIGLSPGESVLAFARRLAAEKPDCILDLHATTRTRLLRLLVPAGRKVVWKKRPWRDNLPVRLGLRPYRAQGTIAARYRAAVEVLVGRALPPGELRYYVSADDQAAADGVLAQVGVDASRPLVAMSPGANWATKQWPTERFAELARRLLAQGAQVVVTGSAAEARLWEPFATQAPGAHDLIGKAPLGILGGILQRCTAFVANDSGPMHMARALGTPTLAIFGSTDPSQFVFDGHGLLFAPPACAPCHFYGRKRCPKGHFRCMLELDVERAWNALRPLLSGGRRLPVVG
jgi:heptosyltransferase II